MNYLSLFSGVEGGGLAFQHLIEPKLKCIGYVEINDYCQRVIQQRIIDGFLDRAPIFGDVKAFINQGYAESYKGLVDVITGGDPCQGNSAAYTHGKRQSTLAPEFIEVIRIVRPIYVIRENPAKVRKDAPSPDWKFKEWLEALGYTATIAEIRACCMGGDHQRARLFVLGQLSDTMLKGLVRDEFKENAGKEIEKWQKNMVPQIVRCDRWTTSPRVCGRDHGVAHLVDRLKAIGNGQVPRVAEIAWKILRDLNL